MMGGLFSAIIAPLFYFWVFRRDVSLRAVGLILTIALPIGCAAALLMGGPSMTLTVLAVVVALIGVKSGRSELG